MNFLCFYAIKTFWWSNKKRIEGKNNIKTISYPRRESNPDQQFRKLLFYPLNYRDNVSGDKITKIVCNSNLVFVLSFLNLIFVSTLIILNNETHSIMSFDDFLDPRD